MYVPSKHFFNVAAGTFLKLGASISGTSSGGGDGLRARLDDLRSRERDRLIE
jgi:hypothetical protein